MRCAAAFVTKAVGGTATTGGTVLVGGAEVFAYSDTRVAVGPCSTILVRGAGCEFHALPVDTLGSLTAVYRPGTAECARVVFADGATGAVFALCTALDPRNLGGAKSASTGGSSRAVGWESAREFMA